MTNLLIIFILIIVLSVAFLTTVFLHFVNFIRMRKHRRYEKLSFDKVTVQVPVLSLKQIGSLILNDVDFDIKAKKGHYGCGSEAFPIPRSFNINSFSKASSNLFKTDSGPISVPPVVPSVAEESTNGTSDSKLM